METLQSSPSLCDCISPSLPIHPPLSSSLIQILPSFSIFISHLYLFLFSLSILQGNIMGRAGHFDKTWVQVLALLIPSHHCGSENKLR